jgi:glycosyltransferase involved in cell wall biosynthesis
MKILLINHNQIGQGTYRRCFNIGKELVKFGHQVLILTTSKKNRIKASKTKKNGLKIVQFPDLLFGRLRNGFCPLNTYLRIVYLSGKDFDIIHAFDTRPVVILPALFYKFKYKVPLVIDWADWWGRGGTIQERSGKLFAFTLGRLETFLEEYFRRFADCATTICSALKKRLISLGCKESNIMLLPQGTNFHDIKALDKNYCRKVLNIDLDSQIIGHLGTLFKNDARLLFDSIKAVKQDIDDIKLFLIGRHKLKLSRYKLTNNFIHETREIEEKEIPFYLSACDILVLPLENNIANNGRWPSKINDYLASGKPIISTPVSDIKIIFEKEKIGILAEDNPEDFSKAILNLLKDKDLRFYLGKKGREYAEKKLNWEILVNNLNKFYHKAIENKFIDS